MSDAFQKVEKSNSGAKAGATVGNNYITIGAKVRDQLDEIPDGFEAYVDGEGLQIKLVPSSAESAYKLNPNNHYLSALTIINHIEGVEMPDSATSVPSEVQADGSIIIDVSPLAE